MFKSDKSNPLSVRTTAQNVYPKYPTGLLRLAYILLCQPLGPYVPAQTHALAHACMTLIERAVNATFGKIGFHTGFTPDSTIDSAHEMIGLSQDNPQLVDEFRPVSSGSTAGKVLTRPA